MVLKRNRSKIVRDQWIKVRVTKEEQEAIRKIAEVNGMAVGNLIRERLLNISEDLPEKPESTTRTTD